MSNDSRIIGGNLPFYSQHGEDIIAWKVLGASHDPRYTVEVGMIDGKRFSNTLAFEQRGWSGLCVEAHPDYVPVVKRNRPGSTVIHAAASDQSGKTMPFHAEPRGDLSSLVPRDEQEMKQRFGHWFQGYKVVDVPVRTLNDMLYEAGAPRKMEMISIDIEGGEKEALRGCDLSYWQPRLLVIEADDSFAKMQLDAQLAEYGYRCARIVGVNALYTRSALDAWRVRMARVDERVLHTAHPGDESIADALYVPSAYETRSQYARRMVRQCAGLASAA